MSNSCRFAIVAIDLWHGALSWWKSTFSSFVVVFRRFLPSNVPIMLNYIHYCWFFLSQGNRWTKYLVHTKIRKPKLCLLMFASLVALDGSHRLLSAQLTADLTPKWSCGSMLHPLSHIYAKKLLYFSWNSGKQHSESSTLCCLWSTVTKRGISFEHSFFNWQIFMHWWIHCRLIFSTPLLLHATSIYDWQKRVNGFFFYFLGQMPNVCDPSIQHHLCLFNHVFF